MQCVYALINFIDLRRRMNLERVSSRKEFHPKALAEPHVNLSAHTALLKSSRLEAPGMAQLRDLVETTKYSGFWRISWLRAFESLESFRGESSMYSLGPRHVHTQKFMLFGPGQ